MIPEDLMRKYKYGYVHSCEMLNEPFVKDLIKENRKLDKENNKLVAKLNKNKILQNEFKEWLEIYIEDRDKTRKLHKEYSLSEEKLSSQYFILQQVLSKYKEIIGDDKNE